MFDLRQQDLLETLARSLTTLDCQPEAQDAMIYRVRVAEKTYGEGSPRVIPWLCDLGDWFADASKFPSGLRALSDYVHSLGMKFGLHFALAEADPKSPRVQLAEGLLYRKQAKTEEATQAFKLAAQNGVPDAHLLLAIIYKENGDYAAAEAMNVRAGAATCSRVE